MLCRLFLIFFSCALSGCAVGEANYPVGFSSAAGRASVTTASSDPLTSNARIISADTSGCVDPLGGAAARERVKLCQLVARYRAGYGLGPVRLNLTLDLTAQFHADDMLARNYFAHVSPEGVELTSRLAKYSQGETFTAIAENIATGSVSAEIIMNQWIASPGHRANLLNPAYRRMGVGVANTYWVQVFSN